MDPRKLLYILPLVSLFALPARADFTDAIAAYNVGDFAEAPSEFQTLAEGGDANAQSLLALMYIEGRIPDTAVL